MFDEIAINLWSFWNFTCMKNIIRTYNLTVRFSKYRNIWGVCKASLQTSLKRNFVLANINETILLNWIGQRYKKHGDSSFLPQFLKIFDNMPLFWNYIGPCPYFETWFSQNRVSMKNLLGLKSSYARSNLKKIKKTWNLSSMHFFFFFFKVWLSITRF